MIEIVINTFDALGTPHIKALKASNPGKKIHVNCGRNAEGDKKLSLWRNCDREIRKWWKRNRESVNASHVAFIEGDVLVNYDLGYLVTSADLLGANIKYPLDDPGWKWFNDSMFLPEETQNDIVGIIPLAVLVFSRRCLDAISESKWDEAYAEDIFCELRTPTIARTAGMVLGTHKALKGCHWDIIGHKGKRPGIWHAVKKN